MVNHKKSSVTKAVKDMSFQEQLEALDRSPIFKQLIEDLQLLSPERREVLREELFEAD